MKSTIRRKISNEIARRTNRLADVIQLDTISDVLRENGFLLIDEDGTPWSGLLLGESSRCTIEVGDAAKEIDGRYPAEKNVVVLSWYRHTTGRYETTAYLS